MCVYNCSAVQTKGIRITFTDGSLKPPEFFFSPAMNVPLPCVCSENGQGQVYGGWMLYTVHGALCLYLCVFVCVHGSVFEVAVHKMLCLVCKQQTLLCYFEQWGSWLGPRLPEMILSMQDVKNHVRESSL